MSIATLERAILKGARSVFKNPKLSNNDIREWSTSKCKTVDGEVMAWIADPGVYVAIKSELDKRSKP